MSRIFFALTIFQIYFLKIFADSSESHLFFSVDDDPLFRKIEKWQGDLPFGKVLDAGTGVVSIHWLRTLEKKGMTHFTGVTATKEILADVEAKAKALKVTDLGEFIVDNWFGNDDDKETTDFRFPWNWWFNNAEKESMDSRLPYSAYDVILLDNFFGAIDVFAPYRQDEIVPRLMEFLKPGGRLYIIGLEPIPDESKGYGDVICRIEKARNTATLLAGHERPYREYPLEWVSNHLKTVVSDIEVLSSVSYPKFYTERDLMDQIGFGREQLGHIQDNQKLVKALNAHFDILEQETMQATHASPKIQLGMEYVLVAEKRKGSDETTVLLEGLAEANEEL